MIANIDCLCCFCFAKVKKTKRNRRSSNTFIITINVSKMFNLGPKRCEVATTSLVSDYPNMLLTYGPLAQLGLNQSRLELVIFIQGCHGEPPRTPFPKVPAIFSLPDSPRNRIQQSPFLEVPAVFPEDPEKACFMIFYFFFC